MSASFPLSLRERVRVRDGERGHHHKQDTLQVGQHLTVGEPQHAPALSGQPGVSSCIPRRSVTNSVRLSIHLDYDLSGPLHKIQDVWSAGLLPAEFGMH